MIVKAFVLKQHSIGKIASLCAPDTIAVIRPQRTIEGMFREAIRKTIQEKQSAGEDLEAIRKYFLDMAVNPAYVQMVEKSIDTISTYVVNATKGSQTTIKTALWALSTVIFLVVILIVAGSNIRAVREERRHAV